MNFQEYKKKQLARKDKSGKGSWDKGIRSLCNKINSKKECYTTSSCSGRISLVKGLRDKAENVFLFKTHKKITFKNLRKELEKAIKKYSGLIYIKKEPCILHVACVDLDNGKEMLKKAREAGWKRSGMISDSGRVILELMSTEKMELPIANKSRVLMDDDFLNLLVREINKKLGRVREKIRKFEKLI